GSRKAWACSVVGRSLESRTVLRPDARLLSRPRVVRHEERGAGHRHDLTAARALRLHGAARGALQERERGIAVGTRAKRGMHDGPPAYVWLGGREAPQSAA